MKNKTLLLLAMLCCAATASAQVTRQPKANGIESSSYVWNEIKDETLLALRTTGDRQRGALAYKVCHGCHRAGALGTSDGIYPRLAGQHDTVLIKQLVDIRTGRRDNPKMYPFASEHGITTQDIADLGAYLSTLPTPSDNGKGDGSRLTRGEALYLADCVSCHGKNGEGNEKKFYPRVAGQHFLYLKQEVAEIANGLRRNANPKMVEVVKRLKDDDIAALADYMSRLPRTGKP